MKSGLRLTEPAHARDPDWIEQAKAVLNLPADAQLELQSVARRAQGGLAAVYGIVLPVELKGAEFGVANGVKVDEHITATLQFDPRGVLASSQVTPVDERHVRLVKDQVRKLTTANEIYLLPPGETVDTDVLRSHRKSWYVETDANGRRRLKRAYMA